MRETIKQPFTNIKIEWEKVKRGIQEPLKETLGYRSNTKSMTYCREDEPGKRKKKAEEQMKRQSAGSRTPQLCV